MRSLSHERCFNHALREAVARCPECRQFYCRECITEHHERVICAACLKKLAKLPLTQRRGFIGVLQMTQLGLGLTVLWLFFHLIGTTLVSIPSSFHDGTVWKPHWLEEEQGSQ
jgi:ANCHR-like B-box zinc-binding domain